jgi:DNA invertase Pin-like site-specific DNA recombinase
VQQKGSKMARGKRVKPEQAVAIIRKIEIMMGEGMSLDEACRKSEISNQSYYRWKKEYGGMDVDQAKRLKELELENSRLKKLVADLALDKAMLKEVAKGNF